jgi:hypothetical protein
LILFPSSLPPSLPFSFSFPSNVKCPGKTRMASLLSRAHCCTKHLCPYSERGLYCPTMALPSPTTWMGEEG